MVVVLRLAGTMFLQERIKTFTSLRQFPVARQAINHLNESTATAPIHRLRGTESQPATEND